ncbi:MAG: hypothetical protein LBG04_04175, partial [Holosporaceae bacterium]|nr:hypothetical protein [Holosporaceae bacterium]
ILNLYYSLGGKYGSEESRTYNIPYDLPSTKPFNQAKSLFTGIKKWPYWNGVYNSLPDNYHSKKLMVG